MTNEISYLPILLYLGAIFWTLGYDTVYGAQDISEDEIIGMKSTAIKFKKNDPTLFFLQRLRDEAHRFAISTHRSKRRKNLKKSLLDQISGIGKSRKRYLLNHFGSAKSVESASFEDLKSGEGIEEKVAQKIHDFFHDN